MKEIGVGVVGLGYMGKCASKICNSIPGVNLVGVVSKTHEKGQNFAKQLNTNYYTTIDELLKADGLDGVIITTPNYLHRDPTIKACNSGKHVFVEKPMALSVKDCDDMIEAAKQAGVILMVGHIMRFFNGLKMAKEIVESNKIGKPMVAHCERTGWEYKQKYISWKKIQAKSGGHLFHHIHEIDILRWWLGEVDKVFCLADNLGHTGPEFGDEDDVILLTIRFKNGALATMHYGSGFKFGDHFIRVSGDLGGVLVSFKNASVKIIKEGEPDEDIPLFGDEKSQSSIKELFRIKDLGIHYGSPDDEPPFYLSNAFKDELVYWINAIRGSEISDDMKPVMDGTAGREAVKIAEAALQSARTGKVVQVN